MTWEEAGFKNRCKWAIVDKAYLTPSGFNEIIAATVTRAQAVKVAKALDIKVSGRGFTSHAIIKLRWKPGQEPT